MSGGKRGSCPYSARKGLIRVEACTEVLYACMMTGRIKSHVMCNGSLNAVSCCLFVLSIRLSGVIR